MKEITCQVIEDYCDCHRKAVLRKKAELPNQHEYETVLASMAQRQAAEHEKRLRASGIRVLHCSSVILGEDDLVLKNVRLKHRDLEAECDFLMPPRRGTRISSGRWQPVIFVGAKPIQRKHKLRLAFVGHVLSMTHRFSPNWGTIITGNTAHKIRLSALYGDVRGVVADAQRLLDESQLPRVALNRHCPYCWFEPQCRAEAERVNDLSLMGGLRSKAIQRYNKKGIFTVHQLSYAFRPRRSRKRKSRHVVHRPELQALALRTNVIYVEELPDVSRHQTEIVLDIEGLADPKFWYLFGVLVLRDNKEQERASLWADSLNQEPDIWHSFMDVLSRHEDAPIYHYGSYETTAIRELGKRYKTDVAGILHRCVNLNSQVHGKVYFPAYSNGLKDIARFLGMRWATPSATGVQAITWRYAWDLNHQPRHRRLLVTYNENDCDALHLLLARLADIAQNAATSDTIKFADQTKQQTTTAGSEIHDSFHQTLVSAHADFSGKKISFAGSAPTKQPSKTRGREPPHSKPQRSVQVRARRKCPKCRGMDVYQSKRTATAVLTDLVFTSNGCRKTVTRYVGNKVRCKKCSEYYNPRRLSDIRGRRFGQNLIAWAIYQRIVLRLPYRMISQVAADMFNVSLSTSTMLGFVSSMASRYEKTRRLCFRNLLGSPAVHIDETKISIRGVDHYVWVLTDGRRVMFELTDSREAVWLHEKLAGYCGVAVSDFFAGYDALGCRQQKCWSHLISDINDDLWKEPFNQELEVFASHVNDLIVPIVADVRQYGLRKRHLAKFGKSIEGFYRRVVDDAAYSTDTTRKYQKRFQRYRESLFTFTTVDDVPWNNNAAERALRHVAVQRKISGSFGDMHARAYLTLLGIAQTCRFQGKSFLYFLLSCETDVNEFERTKRKRRPVPISKPT